MTACSYYTSTLAATESYCTPHVFISSKAFSSTPYRRSRVRHEAGGLPVAQQHRAGRRRSSDRWHTVFVLVLRSYASVDGLRCLHWYGTVRSDQLIPIFAVGYTIEHSTSLCRRCLSIVATFVTLRSIILIELLGLEKLSSAFGLLILVQGVAITSGSPIAGEHWCSHCLPYY